MRKENNDEQKESQTQPMQMITDDPKKRKSRDQKKIKSEKLRYDQADQLYEDE